MSTTPKWNESEKNMSVPNAMSAVSSSKLLCRLRKNRGYLSGRHIPNIRENDFRGGMLRKVHHLLPRKFGSGQPGESECSEDVVPFERMRVTCTPDIEVGRLTTKPPE